MINWQPIAVGGTILDVDPFSVADAAAPILEMDRVRASRSLGSNS
jgi:hypothetical protein